MKLIVGFSRSNLIGSKLIALSEHREYSHVFMVYEHPVTKQLVISHAAHGMVHEVDYNNFCKVNEVIKTKEVELTEEQANDFFYFNNLYKGTKYSITQIIVLALKKLLGNKETLPINGTREFICSEWCYFILTKIGVLSDSVSNADTLTPSDFDSLTETL